MKVANIRSFSRIFLTGFMGAGKSTLGSRLAAELCYDFVDLDARVESSLGMPVTEIFSRLGEEAFRTAEVAELRRSFERERVVVAAGGGALASEENMREALRAGLVVYLSATEDTLKERLEGSSGRPLLERGLDLGAMLSRRLPVYLMADVVLPVDDLGIEEASVGLLEAISVFRRRFDAGEES